VRRLDPDDRSLERLRPISEPCRGRWQAPAGDEQQSRQRASDDDEIAGYGHRLPLLQIEQFRLATTDVRRDNIDSWTSTPPGHQLAHRIQTLL
jgi:hypothetical protein